MANFSVPLPADLPTNWQQGQIVAPNGQDIGLTKQHGYNYVMEMINNAQIALKELAAALGTSESDITQLDSALTTVKNNLNSHIGNKSNPHGVTAAQAGARPDTWMPTAADVGARPNTWTPTAADVGAVPTTRKVNNKSLSADITLSAADVGARPDTWMPTAADVGARPNTWMPTAAQVGAVPKSGGALTGQLSNVLNAQVRNIRLTNTDLTAGAATTEANGTLIFVYEE